MGKKRIGIFGGSFDPPHKAHQRLAQTFLESEFIDELLIIPTFHPPHKSPTFFSYEDRFNFCTRAFSDSRIQISDLESKLPPPSYTVQTLAFLKREHSDIDWVLCMGGDSWQQLHTWREANTLLNYVSILVAERPGIELEQPHLNYDATNVHFCEYIPLPYSSTEIRKSLFKGKIPAEVPEEIHALLKTFFKNR